MEEPRAHVAELKWRLLAAHTAHRQRRTRSEFFSNQSVRYGFSLHKDQSLGSRCQYKKTE